MAQAKHALLGLGLQEVITYSLISSDEQDGFSPVQAAEPLVVENPLSREQEVARSLLLPSLLRVVAYNVNQKQSPVTIFEIADVFFSDDKKGVSEELHLGFALCGARSLYAAQGLIKDELGLLHAKGIIETLCERFGIQGLSWIPVTQACTGRLRLPRSASGIDVFLGKDKIGAVMDVPETLLARFDIKNKKAVAAEIFLEKIFAASQDTKKFTALPLYPGISRDISLVLAEAIPVQEILVTIRDTGGQLLEQAQIVDYYQGKQIAAGNRGLTISCFYRSLTRTLAEEEVTPVHSRVLGLLVEKFRAVIR